MDEHMQKGKGQNRLLPNITMYSLSHIHIHTLYNCQNMCKYNCQVNAYFIFKTKTTYKGQ